LQLRAQEGNYIYKERNSTIDLEAGIEILTIYMTNVLDNSNEASTSGTKDDEIP